MRKGFNAEFQEIKKKDGVILSLEQIQELRHN